LTVVKQVGCQHKNSRFRKDFPERDPMLTSTNQRINNKINILTLIAECETI
jgi:hypothetical protein